jgi:hypothetical protein
MVEFIGLVRRQVQKAKGPFTIRSIFEPLKREPGVVRGSVVRALQRLRKTGKSCCEERKGRERNGPQASGVLADNMKPSATREQINCYK